MWEKKVKLDPWKNFLNNYYFSICREREIYYLQMIKFRPLKEEKLDHILCNIIHPSTSYYQYSPFVSCKCFTWWSLTESLRLFLKKLKFFTFFEQNWPYILHLNHFSHFPLHRNSVRTLGLLFIFRLFNFQ